MSALLSRLHELGRTVIGPAATAVDAEARFPREAIDALRAEQLLSCYVPKSIGGMGLSITELSRVCEVLGTYCASTAMVFAMHQIQVACIVHHAQGDGAFEDYLRELVRDQLLIASATTELGIGGDVRQSICAVLREGEHYQLEKMAPVISYGAEADAILATARRASEAAANDQVGVLVRRHERTLEPLSTWDTLGFRGTCSLGFKLSATGPLRLILPVPYAEVHAKTMHPFSHSVWASLWLGIASDAVARARSFVRTQARKTPGQLPPSALRLAEVDTALVSMRALVEASVAEYQRRLDASGNAPFDTDFGFAVRINTLKVRSSELLIDIVGRAMLVAGIMGYRNDSKHSLGRHLRDAYGASLMVNNDRILQQSATMQIVNRE